MFIKRIETVLVIQRVRICETLYVRNEQNCLQFLYVDCIQCNEQQANTG